MFPMPLAWCGAQPRHRGGRRKEIGDACDLETAQLPHRLLIRSVAG